MNPISDVLVLNCVFKWVFLYRYCLAHRGTQLLQALLDHPAFAPPVKKTAADNMQEAAASIQENLKEGLAGGFKGFPGLKGLKKPSWMS